jgi:phosphotransferase system, enzyme I, PtsP
MLESLRRIVQEVNNAQDLEQALTIIVHRVKQAVGADVCSVYLNDFDNRLHILHATEGLRADAVGRVRLELGRGLIGLVSERAEPINLDDAATHPRYECIIDTGEERYHGFLGAPIIQNRKVLGVLVLRQRQRRHFEEDEVTFVMTLASQLAGAITFARTSGELARLQDDGIPQRFLPGLAASPGIGIGQAVVVYPPADLDAVPDRRPDNPDAEVEDFRRAVRDVAGDLDRFAARTQAHLSTEDMALFDAWRLMLESDTLIDGTLSRIHAGNWAPGALRETIAEHARVFDNMDDPYLRERASDVRDLGRCILMHLQHLTAAPIQYASANDPGRRGDQRHADRRSAARQAGRSWSRPKAPVRRMSASSRVAWGSRRRWVSLICRSDGSRDARWWWTAIAGASMSRRGRRCAPNICVSPKTTPR